MSILYLRFLSIDFLYIIVHTEKKSKISFAKWRYILKNNAINTYLKDLSKQLCCSEKEKKEILSSLKNRLSEFESEYPTALKYEDIVEQFGSPKEVANSFLGEYSSTQLHNLVKRRKIKHFCIITACILIFAALLIYSIRRIYWFYLFQDGYVIETMYDGTDVPGFEELGITNYRTY